jgi:hypothetical protein
MQPRARTQTQLLDNPQSLVKGKGRAMLLRIRRASAIDNTSSG